MEETIFNSTTTTASAAAAASSSSTPNPNGEKSFYGWHYGCSSVYFVLNTFAVLANLITLRALGKHYGLQKIFESSLNLVRAITICELIINMFGIPLNLVDKMFGQWLPEPSSSPWAYLWCILTANFPLHVIYVNAWYLTVTALSRLALVVWPQRSKQLLARRSAQAALIIVPIIFGLLATTLDHSTQATHVVRVATRCTNVPHDRSAQTVELFAQIRLVELFMGSILPCSIGVVAYSILFTFLFVKSRRRRRAAVGPVVSPVVGPVVGPVGIVTIHVTSLTVRSKQQPAAPPVTTSAAEAKKQSSEAHRYRVVVLFAVVFVVNATVTVDIIMQNILGQITDPKRRSDKLNTVVRDVLTLGWTMPLNTILLAIASKDFRGALKQALHRRK